MGNPTSKPAPERLEATFLQSVPNLALLPAADVPEVAFAGRSNAGKSSVLNRVTGNKHMAKVSKTPGRTQLLNLFDVRGGGRIVDLPGYGYAKASKKSQQAWQQAVNDYLAKRESLVGIVLIMDIRHPLQVYDKELLDWTQAAQLPVHVLLNKADKLGRGAQQSTLHKVRKELSSNPMLSLQTFSATKGIGLPQLLALLQSWLQDDVVEVVDAPDGDAPNEDPPKDNG